MSAKIYYFSLILFWFFLSACDKKVEDTELPKLTFTGITNNDTLRNTITAEIKGTDNTGLKSIEVFLNDSLLASSLQPSLGLSWNTLNVKDGDYTIRIVATDNAGNKKAESAKVVVQNALFSFEPNDYDQDSDNTAYIVTDGDGKILNSFKFTKANAPKPKTRTYIYPKTSFSGSTVNIVRVQHLLSYRIEYFINLKRGHYVKSWVGYTLKRDYPNTGVQSFTLKNVPSLLTTGVVSGIDGTGYLIPARADTLKISVNKDSKLLALYENNNEAKYNGQQAPAD
jgi:hypothetical protein